ncbi:Organic hydroperoxide resistance transcriptional regulator [Pseudonocardia sp. Ae168_Ps1]|uniref:MarR family winged helix-turn-helix transcriptional regulator n=1 Tax=unclassified Pseudonocardia TaxID=2619320 RepID=UPI0006CB1054|nr:MULTISPECIES: MarR family transcriptional regulator [unclassified Pseudonocardia]ALE73387.1 MarR family transcriptional regulator [Pseudonocardia sp. EC080625-04]ALL80013.1 MarR family transcriptional regulator [Pseudonocardia sp. EC080619-01]OLL71821.1 Organic hydroperoxide resistance transcriptional regulator [Pseudonocardia sp. Ae150A_Ps1]OLL77789.1 Organic hydroperoxide resistance transcriptional regulator [Pseudonocardia sp. Ae168_Ps1]OLL88087.1 Organic hydroperoxide resistance transcr
MDRTGTVAPLALDEQLCFALHSASRAMTGCYRPILDAIGLTYSQYAVLLVLWAEESVPQRELGERMVLDSGTLSPMLTRLEKRGLVVRARRPDDERTVQVSLTEEGRALRSRAAVAQEQVIRATGMDLDELFRLRDDLQRLAARLRDGRDEHDDHDEPAG